MYAKFSKIHFHFFQFFILNSSFFHYHYLRFFFLLVFSTKKKKFKKKSFPPLFNNPNQAINRPFTYLLFRPFT